MKIKKYKIAFVLCVSWLSFHSGAAVAGLFDNLKELAGGAVVAYGPNAGQRERQDLSVTEIDDGLREALAASARSAKSRIESSRGYYGDPSVRIALPHSWEQSRQVADRIGFSGDFDRLQVQLNQAADAALAEILRATASGIDTIEFDDPRELLQSSERHAATLFLRASVRARVIDAIVPVVSEALLANGAIDTAHKIARRTGQQQPTGKLNQDLARHVVNASVAGFFRQMARHEEAIRLNPGRRTTSLLKKVFG